VVSIDGTTQPGYDPNPGSDVVPTPLIVINGAGAGANADGLVLTNRSSGFTSNIAGLAINGFAGNGIVISGDGNFVIDSAIGTNPAGTAAGPGNGGHGVLITGGRNNFVLENIIAFNGGDGVSVVNGTDGRVAFGNDVDLNNFFSNGDLAVDLGNDGVTPPDPLDADGSTGTGTSKVVTQPNELQNSPVLDTAAVATGGVTVTGHLNTTPNTQLLLQFYYGPAASADAAEGQNISRTEEVMTDDNGNFTFSYLIDGATDADYITATSTATVFSDDGLNVTINGSEFSNAVKAGGTPPVMPRVTQVFVNGGSITGQTSANGIAFRTLAGIDSTFGYPIPSGTAQTKSIPWGTATAGVNQFSLRFDQDVAATLGQDDLVVRGVNTPTYAISSFSYNPATKTGTWTLTNSIVNDKVRLVLDDALLPGLDGEWVDNTHAYPSGDGTPGGDFAFGVHVLRGDASQDGSVSALDLGQVKARLNRNATTNQGSGPTGYSVFADLNGDGQINAQDLGLVKAKLNSRLPAGEPASALLFSNTPLLA
jgi:hypothetical protein